ncbi:MAG: hypothetical protein ACTHN5_23180 [Phycisphaerae bacterium]
MNGAVPSLLAGLHLTTADALDLPQAAGPEKLPQLALGQTHEWFLSEAWGMPRAEKGSGWRGKAPWHPPLTVLAHFAGEAARAGQGQQRGGRIVWVGRNCWPTLQLLCAVSNAPVVEALRRSLFLDPLTDAERFWAIGQALRCPGVAAVVADGSGMNETVSRRLQLAAESSRAGEEGAGAGGMGGGLGLLARPMREREGATWAATRWEVRPRGGRVADGLAGAGPMGPGWEIELIGCRGQHREQDAPQTWLAAWSYQVFRGTGALHLSAGVGHRTAATERAPAFGRSG